MKNTIYAPGRSNLAAVVTSLALFIQSGPLFAAQETLRFTHVVKNVQIVDGEGSSHAASLSSTLPEGTGIRTGENSRAELMFPDKALARLGPQTTIHSEGKRTIDLRGGSILLHVPKTSANTRVVTPLIVASLASATVGLETYAFPNDGKPGSVAAINPKARYKFVVLEGEALLCQANKPTECILISAGHMLLGTVDNPLPAPIRFDVSSWTTGNVLITGFSPLSGTTLVWNAVGRDSYSGTAFRRPGGVDAGNLSSTSIGTINPSNLSGRADVVSPDEQRANVCHSGSALVLPQEAADKHLQDHPDDYAGRCQE